LCSKAARSQTNFWPTLLFRNAINCICEGAVASLEANLPWICRNPRQFYEAAMRGLLFMNLDVPSLERSCSQIAGRKFLDRECVRSRLRTRLGAVVYLDFELLARNSVFIGRESESSVTVMPDCAEADHRR